MTLENQAIMSNYEQLTALDSAEKVWLVRDVTNSKIFVKKQVSIESSNIYHRLQKSNFSGIPKIYQLVEDDESLFIIEEYIHGDNLETLRQSKSFSVKEIEEMAVQICSILDKIHNMAPPIICRDIKPSNIVLSSGKYYLVDFNIARIFEPKLHHDTHLLGTADYAAPEQYGFAQTDACSDIYSLAVTMNVLATGTTPQEKLAKGELGIIIAKATEMDPSNRYQSASKLAESLTNIPKSNRKQSLFFAVPLYLLWALFLKSLIALTPADGGFPTMLDVWSCRIGLFAIAFVPYFYNANFFGLLDRTLAHSTRGTPSYWIKRILYTIIFSLILPVCAVILCI